MKSKALFNSMVLLLFLLGACVPKLAATLAPPAEEEWAPATEAPLENEQAISESAASLPMPAPQAPLTKDGVSAMPGQNVVVQTGADALTSAQTGERMIIKNAEVRLLVENTDNAINRLLQVVGDVGGYVISSRTWYQSTVDGKNYKYATVTMGVPVEQFETAMRRLRSLALQVLDENASGQDVSEEYVDLQSRLTNLEATRDRIRSFLNNAKTIDESLRINEELAKIEEQIEQVKGRMHYLANRAAFSTITVTLEPHIPPITPSPTLTPTPTHTPTPTATPTPWNPGRAFHGATRTITVIYQFFVEALIWLAVVFVPLLIPPLLLFLLARFLFRRKTKPIKSE